MHQACARAQVLFSEYPLWLYRRFIFPVSGSKDADWPTDASSRTQNSMCRCACLAAASRYDGSPVFSEAQPKSAEIEPTASMLVSWSPTSEASSASVPRGISPASGLYRPINPRAPAGAAPGTTLWPILRSAPLPLPCGQSTARRPSVPPSSLPGARSPTPRSRDRRSWGTLLLPAEQCHLCARASSGYRPPRANSPPHSFEILLFPWPVNLIMGTLEGESTFRGYHNEYISKQARPCLTLRYPAPGSTGLKPYGLDRKTRSTSHRPSPADRARQFTSQLSRSASRPLM